MSTFFTTFQPECSATGPYVPRSPMRAACPAHLIPVRLISYKTCNRWIIIMLCTHTHTHTHTHSTLLHSKLPTNAIEVLLPTHQDSSGLDNSDLGRSSMFSTSNRRVLFEIWDVHSVNVKDPDLSFLRWAEESIALYYVFLITKRFSKQLATQRTAAVKNTWILLFLS
jgi:hypothetical protein